MVGHLQWLVTLGRFDLHAQVATMSRFRAAPRQGHMDRLKRIYACPLELRIMQLADHPDYSFLPDQYFDWTYSAYGDVHEVIPDDMPEPLGKAVVTTTTMDGNLNHCLATGKSSAGCLHFVNKTPVDMKFTASKAGPCIWLRKASNLRCYEYITIYVDDLCIATESPSTIIDIFKIKYNLKVKEMEN